MLKLTLDNGLSLHISPEMLEEIVKGYFIENTTFVDEDTEVKVELDAEETTSAPKPEQPKKPRKPYKRRTRKSEESKTDSVITEDVKEEAKPEEPVKEEAVITTAERDLLQEAIDETPNEPDEDAMVEEIVAEIQAKEEEPEQKGEPEVLDLTQSIFG